MKYTDKELESIIIDLRKKRISGALTDKEFFELRHICEDMFTSLKAFLSSIDDTLYSTDDCKAYLKQYLDTTQRFEKLL